MKKSGSLENNLCDIQHMSLSEELNQDFLGKKRYWVSTASSLQKMLIPSEHFAVH